MKIFQIIVLILLRGAIVIFLSCKKQSSVEGFKSSITTTVCDTTITDTSKFVDITLDGIRNVALFNGQGAPCSWGWWGRQGIDDYTDTPIYNTYFIYEGLTQQPGIQIDSNNLSFSFGKNYYDMARMSDSAYIHSFFAQGSYSYATLSGKDTTFTISNSVTYTLKLLTKGVEIAWTDRAGTVWKNWLGSGDQSGSTFTIVKSQFLLNGTFEVDALFSCNLYDNYNHIKKLSNGRFRLFYWI